MLSSSSNYSDDTMLNVKGECYHLLVPSGHWLFVMLLLREHLLRHGATVVLVCDESCSDLLSLQGLYERPNRLSIDEFQGFLLTQPKNEVVNVIIHGHGTAIKPFKSQVLNNPSLAKSAINLSFFCDSVFNDFIGLKDAKILFNRLNVFRRYNIQPGYIFSFGKDVSFKPLNKLGFKNTVVPYKNYSTIFERLLNSQEFKSCEDIFSQEPAVEHVVIIALKPWGAENLRRYRAENGAEHYAQLLSKLVDHHQALNPDQTIRYWIRPDVRALDYTLEVAARLDAINTADTKILSGGWPNWLNLDYILINLKASLGVDVSLICLDSGAGFPFSCANYLTQLFVGAPEADLNHFKNKKINQWCERAVGKVSDYGLDQSYRVTKPREASFVGIDFR